MEKDQALLEHSLKQSVLNVCEKVGSICQDFFKKTGLTYYNYIRIYRDGGHISLTNNKAWLIYTFTHHADHEFIAQTIPPQGHSRYIVWDNDENHQKDSLLKVAREEYDIDHGFTIVTAYEGYVEFQYFASRRENPSINQFYINNLEILNSFGAFFREKACKLIQMVEKEKVFFAVHPAFWRKKVNKEDPLQYGVSRYYLSGRHRNVYLTKREAQCLAALIDGLTAKESARLLKISHRTVHIYLDSVKRKLGCQTRSELFTKAHESGFRSIHMAVRALYFVPS